MRVVYLCNDYLDKDKIDYLHSDVENIVSVINDLKDYGFLKDDVRILNDVKTCTLVDDNKSQIITLIEE